MNSYRIHRTPQILVIFLVALGLLLAGVRVPDLSRPHRPKASHRTILKTQQKTPSNEVKQLNDFIAVSSKIVVSSVAVIHADVSSTVTPLHAAPLLTANSGRSPPKQS